MRHRAQPWQRSFLDHEVRSRKHTRKSYVCCHHLHRSGVPGSEVIHMPLLDKWFPGPKPCGLRTAIYVRRGAEKSAT